MLCLVALTQTSQLGCWLAAHLLSHPMVCNCGERHFVAGMCKHIKTPRRRQSQRRIWRVADRLFEIFSCVCTSDLAVPLLLLALLPSQSRATQHRLQSGQPPTDAQLGGSPGLETAKGGLVLVLRSLVAPKPVNNYLYIGAEMKTEVRCSVVHIHVFVCV